MATKSNGLYKEMAGETNRELEVKVVTDRPFTAMINGRMTYVPGKSTVFLPAHLISCRSDIRIASSDVTDLHRLADHINAYVKGRRFSKEEAEHRLNILGVATLAKFQAHQIETNDPAAVGREPLAILETISGGEN